MDELPSRYFLPKVSVSTAPLPDLIATMSKRGSSHSVIGVNGCHTYLRSKTTAWRGEVLPAFALINSNSPACGAGRKLMRADSAPRVGAGSALRSGRLHDLAGW